MTIGQWSRGPDQAHIKNEHGDIVCRVANHPQQEAHALLIEAAPVMVAALDFIIKELAQNPDHSGSKNPVFYAINRAREAKAKAGY